MTYTEQTVLKALCDAYGSYAVVRAITERSINECLTNYADNHEAIIHKDTATMVDACNTMRNSHPMRIGQPTLEK